MADLAGELEFAIRNAQAAGDAPAVQALSSELQRLRVSQPAQAGFAQEFRQAIPGMVKNADDTMRSVANGMTFGLADKFAGGMDYLTGRAPSYDEGVKAQRAQTETVKEENPGRSMAGEITGGLAGGLGLAKAGLTTAGRFGSSLLGRVFGMGAEGAAYGAAHGAGNTYSENLSDYVKAMKEGAQTGAIIGSGLPVAGQAVGGAYRLGSAFVGPKVDGLSRGSSAIMRTAAQADEAGLRNLPSMGPEAMLVDAGPAMKGLGQGAGTGTGEGRSRLVNALEARDRGTNARLGQALDDNLGPATIPSRTEAALEGNRAYVGQDYGPALANARAVDNSQLANALDVAAVNLRGPAQRAARQVREMLDVAGAPGNLDPYPATLHNTRQAVDGMLATETDPNTIRFLTTARQAIDAELGRKVPGIKDIDAQYQELSRQSAGLQRGSQVLDTGKQAIRPQEFADEMTQGAIPQGNMVGPSGQSFRTREGLRAEVDRAVGTKANDLTALEQKLGKEGDWNYQKMAIAFGDEPTARVAKALMDNRTFRQTYQDIVQNSQSAQRLRSSDAMESSAAGNIQRDTTLTGLGLNAVRLVAKAIAGASSNSTKDEIGQVLASQGPEVQRIAQQLLDSAQTAARNSDGLAKVIGNRAWIGGATSGAENRKPPQL